MKAHQTDFSTGSVYRNILEVAVPTTIAQLINLLYSVVDRIYLGQIPDTGRLALTGVGVCFPIITLISAFTQLFGNGGAPLCAMERGRGNEKEAGAFLGNTFSMLVLTGVILTVLGLLFYKPVLFLFGASSTTFPYAADYIRIYLLGTVFVMISVGMNPFINCQGYANIGMFTVVIGAVLNIVLDPVFIFGLDMGIKGAALATIVSQMCSALWVLWFLTGKKTELRICAENMKVKWQRIRSIIALGTPNFIMNFTNGLVQVTCNTTLQQFGGDIYVAVMTILNSVRDICSMPINGISQGASPVMSYYYGAKSYNKLKQSIRFATILGVSYTLLIWGAIKLVPEAFIRIFNNDPVMIEAAVPSLHMYFFGFCFMAFQFSGQCVFTSLGKAKYAIFFSLLRKVMIVVPLTLLLPRIGNLGVMGVFLAEPISNLIGGLACFTTMILTVWRKLEQEKVNV